jgi:uncharacterized protein YrrD
MKLSRELSNLPIVSIAEGEEVGIVKDFIIDPMQKAIVAIIIEDLLWYEGAKIIEFTLIHSIGDFAITIENVSDVVSLTSKPELADLIKKRIDMKDVKIITRGGRFVGNVVEYSLDDRTGDILGLELSSDSNVASPDKNIIPASVVVTIGQKVIIVNDDVEGYLCSSHAEVAGEMSAAPRAAAAPAYTPPPPAPKPQPVMQEPAAPKISEPVFDEPEISEPELQDDAGGIDADTEVDIEELLDLDQDGGLIDDDESIAAAADEAAAAAQDAGFDDVEIDTEIAEEAGGDDSSKESLSEIFERRQIKYMLGKKVSRDIEADDGSTVINQGEIITDDVIAKAKQNGKFLELSMNIEIEE